MRLDFKPKAGLSAPVIIAAAFFATICVQDTYGQRLRVSLPSDGGFGGITNIGKIANTTVSNNFNNIAPGFGANQRPLGTRNVPESAFFQNRGLVRRVDLISANPVLGRARQAGRIWQQMLGPGGVARYFAAPPQYVANNVGGTISARGLNGIMLLDPQMLVRSTSFAAAAQVRGITSGGVRDILSLHDDSNTPRYSVESRLIREAPSQSALMESRLKSMRKRYMTEAWDWFQRGEYQRARSVFKSAEILDRTPPEPRIGVFFCCVAEGKYYQTTVSMGRLMRWDGRKTELFDTDFDIRTKYEVLDEPEPLIRAREASTLISRQINGLMRFANDNQSEGIAYAALCFGLWQAEYYGEAAQAARSLQEIDPNGPYARFGLDVLEALERRKTAGLDQ